LPSVALKTEEIAKLANVNKRKLRYWVDLKLVKPYRESHGKGITAEFSIENLVHLYIIRELSDSGLKTTTIKSIMNEVRKCDFNSLPNSIIITNGKDFFEVSERIDFERVFDFSPIFVMRIYNLFHKALRDMELFTNQTFYKEDYHVFNRN